MWPGIGRFLRWRWGRLTLQNRYSAYCRLRHLRRADRATTPLTTSPPSPYGCTIGASLCWPAALRQSVVHELPVHVAAYAGTAHCQSRSPLAAGTAQQMVGYRCPRRLLFLYEWLDLWAGPWWTAWIVVGYFGMAFLLEALFAESPFCKYICPLGTFNFCQQYHFADTNYNRQSRCLSHLRRQKCINGSAQVLGCGTELFAPQITSNLDCTLCLDCVRLPL